MSYYGITESQQEILRRLVEVARANNTDRFVYDYGPGTRFAIFGPPPHLANTVKVEPSELTMFAEQKLLSGKASEDADGVIIAGYLLHRAHEAVDTNFKGPLKDRARAMAKGIGEFWQFALVVMAIVTTLSQGVSFVHSFEKKGSPASQPTR